MGHSADSPTLFDSPMRGGPSSGPVPGQRWGKFLIEKVLGRGGQADVLQAFDQVGTAGHVALKVPHDAMPQDWIEQWVHTEAGTLTKLSHPSIVRVVEAGVIGTRPYVATELVEGLALHTLVRTSPPSETQIVSWMSQLGEALQEAHERGVVHRDVKPHNIIVTPEGRPTLIDFGLASFVTAYQTESRRDASGTYAFMAPEQARRDPHADHRVDVFALGGILKFVLTGKPPYAEGQAPSPGDRSCHVSPIEEIGGSGLRRSLCGIANKALEPDPADRYQNMREMLQALHRASSRRQLVWAGVGAVVLLAVVAIFANWMPSRGDGNQSAAPNEAIAVDEDPGGTDGAMFGGRLRIRVRGENGEFKEVFRTQTAYERGSEIQLAVRFDEAAFPYVLHAGGQAPLKVVYPGPGTELKKQVHFVAPAPDRGVVVEESGLHLLFVLGRTEAAAETSVVLRDIAELASGVKPLFAGSADVPGRLERREEGRATLDRTAGAMTEFRELVANWRQQHPEYVSVIPQLVRVRAVDLRPRRRGQ